MQPRRRSIRRVAHSERLESESENLVVIESQLRRLKRGMPHRFRSIICSTRQSTILKHARKHDADRMPARIATRVSVRSSLLELDTAESGLFTEFSRRSIFKRFVFINEAAGKSPLILEWFAASFD